MQQTWKGTYDASLDIWFSTYPSTTRVDGTDWYLNEWKMKGHGVTWPLIIFTHATQISSVKGLQLEPFFRGRAAKDCASRISR